MSVVAAALSKETRLAMSAVGTASPIDEFVTFTRFSPGASIETIDTARDVNFGSRSHLLARTRNNYRRCAPSGSFKPTIGEWGMLLPWVMCGAVSGTTTKTYALGETATVRTLAFDDTQLQYELDIVAVNRATFAASAGAELTLDLEMIGVDFATGGTFPTGLSADDTPPLLLNDLALTVGGTAVSCRSFRLTVDNGINAQRFFNSPVLAGPVAMDRMVSVSFEVPWGASSAIWGAGAVDAGVSIVATFTYGAKVLTMTMPTVRAPEKPIDVHGPDEIMLTWEGQALATTGGNELSITLTP